MITGGDLYNVLTAVVPLYVAMILAYGSVKWWKIFTPDQCAGINRFVALFAVPLLSFHFISTNNPYTMNFKFIAADSLQKLMILAMLSVWTLVSKSGSLDWMITLFSLSTLPNTLVMGIPLLKAMYGDFSGDLMVQVVVLQCIVWYTLMLFMFEYRGAKLLIMEQFPDTGASIVSFRVDSDVVSLDGRQPLQADTEIGGDGRLHVTVRKSTSCRSISHTPRPSNMSNAEIYSNPTPRGSSFNHADFYSMFNNKSPRHSNFGPQDSIYSVHSSKVPTPRTSNFDEDAFRASNSPRLGLGPPMYSYPHQTQRVSASVGNGLELSGAQNGNAAVRGHKRGCDPRSSKSVGEENKDLHMFVWSTSASPVSEAATAAHHTMFSVNNTAPHLRHASCDAPPSRGMFTASPIRPRTPNSRGGEQYEEYYYPDEFTFGNNRGLVPQDGLLNQHVTNNRDSPLTPTPTNLTKLDSTSSTTQLHPKGTSDSGHNKMPPASVMTRLILIMVWRKLIRNPNTYSSLFGLSWALITFRWNIQMPKIIEGSIRILSDAGLGMAMFSLGLFMALQPKIIACGNSVAAFAMAVRFLTGPAVMAAASISVGLRGVLLHVGIVQAALPQGIVPFVFAKEYNLHPDILSTGVIFGMLIALPITLVYYVLLGL